MLIPFAAVTAAALVVQPVLTRPAEAVTYALADVIQVPEAERIWQRYFWVPDGSVEGQQCVQLAVNYVSRASRVIRAAVVANGFILRVDARAVHPQNPREFLSLWDRMASGDPYFYVRSKLSSALPVNAQQIESKANDPPGSQRFQAGGELWFRDSAGSVFRYAGGAWVKQAADNREAVAFAGHVDLRQAVLLQGATACAAPICRYDRACVLMLTTLDGGLYYEFAGIRGDQDAVFKSVGADLDLSAKLRADQRAATMISDVTKKPRATVAGQGVIGEWFITLDLNNDSHRALAEKNQVGGHPIKNLLEFDDDAREFIARKQNGFNLFALFDGDGKLQRSVPDTVARDGDIPPPATAILQPATGCIRCHGASGGWQPIRNDVADGIRKGLYVIGDFSQFDQQDARDRIEGLYLSDIDRRLQEARDYYADAVFVATGLKVPAASALLGKLHLDYRYGDITPVVACRELGYATRDADHAIQLLNQLLPTQATNDPFPELLKRGIPIGRPEWDQIYADLALQASLAAKGGVE